MGKIHDAWVQIFRENASIQVALTWILVRKFSEQGVTLSKEQVKKLETIVEKQLKDYDKIGKGEKLKFEIHLEDEEDIQVTLTEITLADYKWFKKNHKKIMDKALLDLIDSYGDETLKSWKAQSAKVLAEDREEDRLFREYFEKTWGKALETLEILLSICTDLGIKFKSRKHTLINKDDIYILDALIKLQARGCRVGREILILLKNGMADGALARWRTLQEIAVFASFIDSQNNKVALRYLLHSAVDEFAEMNKYKTYYKKLGYKPIPKRVWNNMVTEIENLKKEYGPNFTGYYGWAAEALGKTNPSLEDIENATKQRYWQPYIQFAHAQIHALSGGMTRSLGMPPSGEIIMYGASVFGISHPGRNTAHSLGLLTGTLISRTEDADELGITQALIKLVNEVYQAFDSIDESAL